MWTATVFDTETPGFKSPGIMQLAATKLDKDFNIVGRFECYVKPQFYTEVEPGAFNAHGISLEDCDTHGIPLIAALGMLGNFVKTSAVVVCHNTQYDFKVTSTCLGLLGREDFLENKQSFCTMLATMELVNLPGKYGKPKWPKLQETYYHFFNKNFDGAHNAGADVDATVQILQHMKAHYPELLKILP